jgi:hypothetical protein
MEMEIINPPMNAERQGTIMHILKTMQAKNFIRFPIALATSPRN